MILQALVEYYERKKDDLPNFGFERKEIPYIIVLDKEGKLVNIETTYEGDGKNQRARTFLLPQSVKRTSAIVSNLLWDNPEYAIGIKREADNGEKQKENKKTDTSDQSGSENNKEEKENKKTKENVETESKVDNMHRAFREKIDALDVIGDGVNALKLFLTKDNKDKEKELSKFKTVLDGIKKDKKALITFRLDTDTEIIAEKENIKNAIQQLNISNELKDGRCLITGNKEGIEKKHTVIKGVWKARSSGANIVSFNSSAYCSYGKEQGENAPCGSKAVFAYTTALNSLLSKSSSQKMQVGDATTVFWSEKVNNFEEKFLLFFESPKDNPDAGTDAVKELINSINNGALNFDENNKTEFYVLGLSPKNARIAVRFFVKDTVFGMSKNIAQHFKDLKIDKPKNESEFLSLFKLLVSTAVLGKAENISPNLAGNFFMSILKGLPYPQTLLQAMINRIKAEQKITYARAALIKAYLNRNARYKNKEEEIKVSLNKENTDQGYVLGRLFATLVKLQEDALGTTNSTIMRFYGAASSSPVTVYANLMRLHQHHLERLRKEKPGMAVNYEKLIGEIQSKIDDKKGYPSHFSLTEQGKFAIGYYQQRQDFFKTKEEKLQSKNN